jgi:hypothetical protein
MLAYFTAYLIAAVLSSTLAVSLAHYKNRTWLLWGAMCLFFPPMVLMLLALSKRSGAAPYEDEANGPGDDEGWLFWS